MEIRLQNISTTGACIMTERSLKPSDKYLIQLRGKGIHLNLLCRTIWESTSHDGKNSIEASPVYRIGLSFTDVSSDKLVILKDFIRISGTPYEQRLSNQYGPSALRFRIHVHEKAVLYSARPSYVKKISLGGMLTVFDNEIPVERNLPMALFLPKMNLPIRFHGRVASCIEKSDRRSNRFDVGIEFLGMAEDNRVRLSRFLDAVTELSFHEKLRGILRKNFFLQKDKDKTVQ